MDKDLIKNGIEELEDLAEAIKDVVNAFGSPAIKKGAEYFSSVPGLFTGCAVKRFNPGVGTPLMLGYSFAGQEVNININNDESYIDDDQIQDIKIKYLKTLSEKIEPCAMFCKTSLEDRGIIYFNKGI